MARVRHPNVVTVFGAAVHDGRPGLWMELVRGRTLAERVQAEGPLPWRTVARIGIELCRALKAVHDAHLVHQDVKARNVMERDEGGVVLMDFGAGAARRASDDAPQRLEGTPLYMAPEVVLGGPPTAQSDLYSLGVLLYYLLTGAHPVRAASWGELQVAYERGELSAERAGERLRELRPDVPEALAVGVALAMAPAGRRYRSATDLRRALEATLTTRVSGPWRLPTWVRPRSVAVLAAVLAAFGLGVWAARPRPATAYTLVRLTADAGLSTDPARSADGALVVYASDRSGEDNLDLWLQRLPGGTPVRLTEDPADESQPTFSPDGNHIAYRSERDGGGVYLMPAFGGEARLLIRSARHPRFSPDGRHLAYIGGKGLGTLGVTTLNGGSMREPVEGAQTPPIWSPDGRHVLVAGRTGAGVDWLVVPLPGHEGASPSPVRLGAFATLAHHGLEVLTAWPTPGDWVGNRIVFHARRGDTTSLWDIEVSPAFELIGPPRRLTFSTEDQLNPSVARDGSVLFSTRTESPYLWELRLDTDEGHAPPGAPPRPVILIPHYPGRGVHDLSTDGRTVAYASVLPRDSGMSIRDLDTGVEKVLTTPSLSIVEKYPVLSRDGKTLLYGITERGQQAIRRVSVRGGMPETICDGCGPPTGWSDDERFILTQEGVPLRGWLGILDTTTGRRADLLKHHALEFYRGGFSPDAKWVAFHSALPSGQTQEFIAPFRGPTPVDEKEWIAITSGDSWSDAPCWSPNGNLVYYLSDRDGFRCVWAQRLDPATKRPVGEPFAVYHPHGRKHSMGNVHHWAVELSVAQGKLVFNMGAATGNVWLARPQLER